MGQKDLLDCVMEGVQEGIVIVNSDDIIVKSNKEFNNIVQLPEKKIIGDSIHKVLPALMPAEGTTGFGIQFSDNELLVREELVLSENGDNLKIYFLSKRLDSELGQKYTEVKMLKETYENILNSIDEGVYFCDINGQIRFYNPSMARLDGYKVEHVLGKHITDIYKTDWNTSLSLTVLRTGQPIIDYLRKYTTCNGITVNAVCSVIPLYSGGKLIGSASIEKDFSKFIEIAERISNLQAEDFGIRKADDTKHYNFSNIISKDPNLLESIHLGKMAAKTESPVLIYGETGTGKEIFAQSIHAESRRSKGPFLAINCAAIPENLLEGILFGTVKGAFTGSIDRKGLLEQANGGTVYLDEINSMPVTLQSKLLRVLEEKKVRRLGDKKEIPVDMRIISSCNVEPTDAIAKGHLRSDLFYRLAVIYLYIPPLRERLDDLELSVQHFIMSYNKQMQKNIKGISPEVLKLFRECHWLGNIRQLKHCIECAMTMMPNDADQIELVHIPKYLNIDTLPKNINNPDNLDNNDRNIKDVFTQIKKQEQEAIIESLKRNRGNISKAAEDLGISRQRLQYRIKKLWPAQFHVTV
ncbi:MAG: sigma-54 interaction domain-containing protein [Eubacteriales bacterium]